MNSADQLIDVLYRYNSKLRHIQWLAAGLGAELAIYVAFVGPIITTASFLTKAVAIIIAICFLAAAIGLFYSLADYDWRADLIRRIIAKDAAAKTTPFSNHVNHNPNLQVPRTTALAYLIELVFVMLGGVLLIVLLPIALLTAQPGSEKGTEPAGGGLEGSAALAKHSAKTQAALTQLELRMQASDEKMTANTTTNAKETTRVLLDLQGEVRELAAEIEELDELLAIMRQIRTGTGGEGTLADTLNALFQLGGGVFERADPLDSFLGKFSSAYAHEFGGQRSEATGETINEVGRWLWGRLTVENQTTLPKEWRPASFTVYFESDLRDATNSLDQAITWANGLELHAGCTFGVSGHSDTEGQDQRNRDLASARANHVANRLRAELSSDRRAELGPDFVRNIESWGERRLANWTGDNVKNLENRRVEISVHCPPKDGS